MTKRIQFSMLAAACAALAISAAPAVAGEVTGNGKPAQGAINGASICAFSGQNDHPLGAPGDFPGRVQNFGHFLKSLAAALGLDWLSPQDSPFSPGDQCRGNLPDEGPV